MKISISSLFPYRARIASFSRWMLGLLLVGVIQLTGCTTLLVSSSPPIVGTTSHDGPPPKDIDVAQIKDAVPRWEPYHPYGTRGYTIKGKYYRVLQTSRGYVREGYASWYGNKFHGRLTSTQEVYNLYTMTAASPELPLPSYVEVINLRNGKKIIVKVNDRGPFYGNRIIDLSYAAAKKLDFVREGVAPVRVVAIDPRTWQVNRQLKRKSPKEAKKIEQISLQLGVFSQLINAERLASRVRAILSSTYRVEVRWISQLYRVRVGPTRSLDEALRLKALLENKGFDDIMLIK